MFEWINEKKAKKKEEEENKRLDAEYDAKQKAREAKRKTNKIIADIDASLEKFKQHAIDAKARGYDDMYKKSLTFIRFAKIRRMQAEKFLFEMEQMEEMQKISNASAELLSSINSVASSLGKFCLDPKMLAQMENNFKAAERQMDAHADVIGMALDRMEMSSIQNEDYSNITDKDIEAELFGGLDLDLGASNNAASNKSEKSNNASSFNASVNSAPANFNNVNKSASSDNKNIDQEMESLKRLLGE